jgi:uncharacterized Zn finger protein (UPF0148 family)
MKQWQNNKRDLEFFKKRRLLARDRQISLVTNIVNYHCVHCGNPIFKIKDDLKVYSLIGNNSENEKIINFRRLEHDCNLVLPHGFYYYFNHRKVS